MLWEPVATALIVVFAIASGAPPAARLEAMVCISTPLCAGWLMMWSCVLSKIGFVRALFDLDLDSKKGAARKKQR